MERLENGMPRKGLKNWRFEVELKGMDSYLEERSMNDLSSVRSHKARERLLGGGIEEEGKFR